jgi:Putative transmembrane protein (PGPGW)
MFSRFKRQWRELRSGRPGQRFRAQFERRKKARVGKSFFRRWVTLVVAATLLIIGFILCFIPGPGIPFLVIGVGLLAEEFRSVASALDWSELKLRKLITLGLAWWRRASIPARGTVGFLLAIAIAGVGYGAFHVVFRG